MATMKSNKNATVMPGVNQGISARIGRSAAELSRPCFPAGTSRVSRSRAAKALGLRKRRAVTPQSPPSPNQESAVNTRTGKVAFGPWLGPYETHNDAPSASEPLFLDHAGNTYASLSGINIPPSPITPQTSAGIDVKSPTANATTAAAAAAATQQQLYAMVGKVVQRQALAAANAHAKPSQWPGCGRRGGGKALRGGGGRCSTTMARAINQPRRS